MLSGLKEEYKNDLKEKISLARLGSGYNGRISGKERQRKCLI